MSLQNFDGPSVMVVQDMPQEGHGAQVIRMPQEGHGAQVKRKRAHRDPSSGLLKDGIDKFSTEVQILIITLHHISFYLPLTRSL